MGAGAGVDGNKIIVFPSDNTSHRVRAQSCAAPDCTGHCSNVRGHKNHKNNSDKLSSAVHFVSRDKICGTWSEWARLSFNGSFGILEPDRRCNPFSYEEAWSQLVTLAF